MKKKLLLAGAMLLLAVAAVTGFAAYEKSNVSFLLDANVEALALNETVENAFVVSAICPNCGEEIDVEDETMETQKEIACPACGNSIPMGTMDIDELKF